MSDPSVPDAPATPCRFLRSKGMYVYTDGHGNPNASDDDGDGTFYWCVRTMKGYGPDDEQVDRASCVDTSRSCHEPT